MNEPPNEFKQADRAASESEPEPIISLQQVSKRFDDTVAVDQVDLDVFPGDIYGFIGPNGAGKTTTLKLVATLLTPDSGRIVVGGNSTATRPRAVRRTIGYMPDFLGVYHGLTTTEYLDFFGATYRIPPNQRRRLISDLLALTDLTEKRGTLVTSLSRGMQQRLGLARALIHDPEVLLLDEPASGLDPRARVEIRELLKELSNMGKTILISSHILADLEELSNRIGIIERGTLLYSGEIEAALKQLRQSALIEVRVAESASEALKVLDAAPEIETAEVQNGSLLVQLKEHVENEGVIASRLVASRFSVTYLARQSVRLEDAFLSITEGKVQ